MNKIYAIVNVNKHSAYAHLNGLTFEVKEIRHSQIDLLIEGRTVCFGHKEVMICDLQNTMQKVYDNRNWSGGSYERIYNSLELYVKANEIKFKPTYTEAI